MVPGESGVATRSSPRAVGVITNHTGFDVEGRRTIDILAKAPGIKLVAIFSPEHGVTGELDVNSVGDSVDRATGVHIYSIYGDTTASRHPPESVLRKLDVRSDRHPGHRLPLLYVRVYPGLHTSI